MSPKLLFLAVAALAAAYFMFGKKGDVSSATARELVQKGAHLVDVRTRSEFGERHLPGALNLPVQDLEGRLGELGAKDQPIVLYCRSGQRSARAARILKAAGFTAVHDLGSISNW